MNSVRIRSSWAGQLAGLLLGLLLAAQAQASLVGSSVTVQLLSPNGIAGNSNPVSLSQGVTVGAGPEITAGVGAVGGFLLTGATASEFIDFGAFDVTLRLLSGDPNAPDTTGYAAGAKLVFSGLGFPGEVLFDATGSSSGISNFSQAWITLDSPSQVSFALADVLFDPVASGTRFGDVTIRFQTRPDTQQVPEPGSLALAGLALSALVWGRRRAPES